MKIFLYKQKRKFIQKVEFIHFLIKTYFTRCFNSVVREQEKDPKKIPIIIISFNQLYYLKQLIDFLKKHDYNNIVIIDNNSTYKPLLDYFETIESLVSIYRLNENLGHLVFWKNKELFDKYSKGFYVVTDSDIVPDDECPENFVLHFKKILNKNLQVTKVGFSLKIDDLPDSNLNKQKVMNWEQQFWNNKTAEGDFNAYIDTTFALYRPNYKYDEKRFFAAIRTQKPYQSIHGGWYLDTNNLSGEQVYYYSNCNESSSWRIDNKGDLINKELL